VVAVPMTRCIASWSLTLLVCCDRYERCLKYYVDQ